MSSARICEPLFQYICRVNRSARKGGVYDQDQVRGEVKEILANIRKQADADPVLAGQFDPKRGKLWLVLLFFVDFMIRNSSLSFALDWADLARDELELAGDEKFFELLDETLADKSDAAADRLAVFYTCLGLGFTGFYTGQPEFLRRKSLEISARLRGVIGNDGTSRICPEAYEGVNTNNLVQPPSTSLIGIGIALVGMLVVLFVANFFFYKVSKEDLERKVEAVLKI